MVSNATDEVQFFNDQWYAFTGQRDLDQGWLPYLHPEDTERVLREWQAAVARGDLVVPMEYRLRHQASGTYRWFAAKAVALVQNDQIVNWVGVAVDVHDRKISEDDLSERYFREREVADAFQRSALPAMLPVIAGASLDAVYIPGTHDLAIGGDWYDAFTLEDGATVVSVGDVLGHGLEAAVTMSKIRETIRAIAFHCGDFGRAVPSEIFRSVERALALEHPNLFATSFIAVIHPDRQSLRASSAGHPPAVFRSRDGGIFRSTISDPPLGFNPNDIRRDFTLSIADADLAFFYTDGLLESRKDYLADEALLGNLLASWSSGSINGMCASIAHSLTHGQARDDVAALAIQFHRTAAEDA